MTLLLEAAGSLLQGEQWAVPVALLYFSTAILCNVKMELLAFL